MNNLNTLSSDADLEYLGKISGGKPQVVQQFVSLFITQTTEFLREIDEFLEQQDWPKVASCAHKAKSSIAIMGLTEISHALDAVEISIDAGNDLEQIPQVIKNVQSACVIAIEKLSALSDAA